MPLIWSSMNSPGEVRLKPKRVSITKVEYSVAGRPTAPLMASTATNSATPWIMSPAGSQ